jgi:hypothetical protein
MEFLTVGSVRSEYTPVEIDTSVTYLPKGKGATLGGGRDRVWSLNQEAPKL